MAAGGYVQEKIIERVSELDGLPCCERLAAGDRLLSSEAQVVGGSVESQNLPPVLERPEGKVGICELFGAESKRFRKRCVLLL